MLQQKAWTKHLTPGLIVVLIISYIYYVSRDFLLVGILLGLSSLGLALQVFFDTHSPTDRFHALQPWKIPDPATRAILWLLAGFDALLYLPVHIAFVLLVTIIADLTYVFIGLAITIMSVVTILKRYWRMRRQYELVPNRDGEKRRGVYLSYVGVSDMSRREKTTMAIITAALLIGWILVPLLWILWIARA